MKPRRTRSKTVGAAVGAFVSANAPLLPPPNVKLSKAAEPFWPQIILTRARAEWTESDLLHAVNLARAFADIERISAEIAGEGDVIENQRGTLVANPKHTILETLSRRAIALTKLLQLDAHARVDKRDVVGVRQAEREARKIIAEAAEDVLLA